MLLMLLIRLLLLMLLFSFRWFLIRLSPSIDFLISGGRANFGGGVTVGSLNLYTVYTVNPVNRCSLRPVANFWGQLKEFTMLTVYTVYTVYTL